MAEYSPLRRAGRSLVGRILAIALVFLIVPVILYYQFASADLDRQNFLLRTLQSRGKLVAHHLTPLLTRAGRNFLEIGKEVESLDLDQMRVKLLLRPTGQDQAFYLVAANPPLDPAQLDQEPARLEETGVLPKLDASCDGDQALSVRYRAASGAEELLTSMSPLHSTAGCWVILTSFTTGDLAAASLARPFTEAPEVRMALAFYLLMALLIAATLIGAFFDLRAFVRIAKQIRQGGAFGKPSFAAHAAIPELVPAAREFDGMVANLQASANALREAAEDNAHAFKAPIAAITQAVEPLRARNVRAVATIDDALRRLNTLVQAAKRLDEAAAEVMMARLQPVDMASLAQQMAASYDRVSAARNISVKALIQGTARVLATEDALETVIENLLDNAVGFSPEYGIVTLSVTLAGRQARLCVEDEGPGVPADRLASIFRRNFSFRPAESGDHSGIGLAVVRRTVELLGGEVAAENRPQGGFSVTITLPRL